MILKSVPRYLCSTFGGILIKINTFVKEVHLKSMKSITGAKTDFLRIYMGNAYIFSSFGNHTESLAQFFKVIIEGAFQRGNLGLFSFYSIMSIEVYEYRII